MPESLQELSYRWPPNIGDYEVRWFGINAQAWMAAVVVALLPLALVRPEWVGGLVALVMGGGMLLMARRWPRLGNLPLPVYGWRRMHDWRTARQLELPLTLGTQAAAIEVEDEAGWVVVES